MRKSLVFTIAVGSHRKLFKSCVKTQQAYARRHGHDFLIVDETPRELLPDEASWLKIGMIRAALLHGYEWVAFIDADCDVRPHTPCFAAEFAKFGNEKSLYLAPGISGRLNAGVIFARNAPGAISFFKTVDQHADMQVAEADRTCYENGHVIHFTRGNPHVQVVEHRLWNNNSQMDDSSYIQHYSGGPLRLWYMEHRAPWRFTKRVVRKIGRVASGFLGSDGVTREQLTGKVERPQIVMSERLQELQPFYFATYPEFRHTPPSAADPASLSAALTT